MRSITETTGPYSGTSFYFGFKNLFSSKCTLDGSWKVGTDKLATSYTQRKRMDTIFSNGRLTESPKMTECRLKAAYYCEIFLDVFFKLKLSKQLLNFSHIQELAITLFQHAKRKALNKFVELYQICKSEDDSWTPDVWGERQWTDGLEGEGFSYYRTVSNLMRNQLPEIHEQFLFFSKEELLDALNHRALEDS